MATYTPHFVEPVGDHDACGVGFIADRTGRPSHACLSTGLEALNRLAHRGATGDGLGAADGCGVLTAIPWDLLAPDLPRTLRGGERVAGMCLLPPDASHEARRVIAMALEAEGWSEIWWREVPIDRARLSGPERVTCPDVIQLVARSEGRRSRGDLERSIHRARMQACSELGRAGCAHADLASLSLDTMVFKALVVPSELPRLLPDLADRRFVTPFVVFHQRFSTNTFPDWAMAQPFQFLAHNGEINTIVGNRLKAMRRDSTRTAGESSAPPRVRPDGSDSRSLDDAVGELRLQGLSLPHAAARVIRRSWEHDRALSAEERAFEQYQSCVGDSWEGPAALAMADGRYVGMMLDRSGFRPVRVLETRSGLIVAGSETGIVDVPEPEVVARTRLGPGQMLFVDLAEGVLLDNQMIRRSLALRHPYRQWVSRSIVAVPPDSGLRRPARLGTAPSTLPLRVLQRHFGYTAEELEVIIRPMGEQGTESTGSMGDDTPLAALGTRARVLPDFFRQRFAQVTNPPLDPLRERAVMSLRTYFGREGDHLSEDALDARMVTAESPVLTEWQLSRLSRLPDRPVATLSMLFDPASGAAAMQESLAELEAAVIAAVKQGNSIVVLSDRDVGDRRAPLPALLAVAAVHQSLAHAGLGTRAAIVVDTGDVRDAHQLAVLLAFGAAAVCPWLGYLSVAALAAHATDEPRDAQRNYRRALEQGLLKILSKMGVCTVDAYRGSQLFEIIGLAADLCARYFPATAVIAGRVSLQEIASGAAARHRDASTTANTLPHPGFHGFRNGGDHHVFNPVLVRAFHAAAATQSADAYTRFTSLVQTRPPTALRDLLTFDPPSSIPLDQVEPVDAICRRFFASAMSVGALGPEAHRALAIALNRLGGRSNSGEGGEEADRYVFGTEAAGANSATKQVASARFGVTPAYLVSARELQIKMAQGSKPGEGGQLPAQKVVDHIARLRYARPGTPLISPPPHHDIYSIEDLAQLIYDLRALHPAARMNVKLVSTTGVGVIAVGVVKAGADAIQISGHSGGTGASPRGSIKHAGLPWEIGLLEAHRVLTLRGMRGRVVLQTDGGLVTGRDIAMAAALGADEYGFGTAALVALGCVMARQCHLNTCPVGIATQRTDLRAKFAGTPDQVIAYLRLVAGETREILSQLGLRSLRELIGRVDLLAPRTDIPNPGIDVASVLGPRIAARPTVSVSRPVSMPPASPTTLDTRLMRRARADLGRVSIDLSARIRNTDRSVGASLMGVLARQRGNQGSSHAPVRLSFHGDAGQSFGAFALPGVEISLCGTANDGVAKGMHGGRIAIRPMVPAACPHVVIGNAALYGATGGHLFVAGLAGERFAVRNSGAIAVVEGVGNHGCEYMTGGLVVVLGETGVNFAAGMTGGLAVVYDRDRRLRARVNGELVTVAALPRDVALRVRALVGEHYALTGSAVAAALLEKWSSVVRAFRLVSPVEEASHVTQTSTADPDRSAGLRPDSLGVAADAGAHGI